MDRASFGSKKRLALSILLGRLSAACMASHPVEARFCRWLLRARDMTGRDTVGFTQEFLAEMLGVQWTTVSLRLKRFNKPGLLNTSVAKFT